MRKPVSLAPVGLSLQDAPVRSEPAASTGADNLSAPVAAVAGSVAPMPARVREIAVAAQIAEASVEPPAASIVADVSQTVFDYWMRQADSFWAHGVALSQARSVSDMIESQGHFVRQQVEIARAQAATWSSLLNQTAGINTRDRFPAFAVWAPWQTTLCKPGG